MTTIYRFRQPTTLAAVLDRIPTNHGHPVPEPGLRIIRPGHGPRPGAPVLAFTNQSGGTVFAHPTVLSGVALGRLTTPRLELTFHGAYDRGWGEIVRRVEAGFGPAFAAFPDREAAFAWLAEQVGDTCVDNHRCAPLDDLVAMSDYADRVSDGCCGFADYHVYVGERLHAIGCNYGH